ncbi:hypothetical protein FACS1894125_3940 [Actinomycetota bacterium]|nr:hypothetical protein FACS1894125_3940 [Actinomycetota bacterium]
MKIISKFFLFNWILNGIDNTVSSYKKASGRHDKVVTETFDGVQESVYSGFQNSLRVLLNVVKFALYIIILWLIISLVFLAIHGSALASSAKSFISAMKDGSSSELIDSTFQSTAKDAVTTVGYLRSSPILYTASGIPGLGTQMQNLDETLTVATTMLGNTKNTPKFASDMLGFNGKRLYLLASQGNAQIKSLGGSAAQMMSITFDKGSFDMGASGNTWSMPGGTNDMAYRSIQPFKPGEPGCTKTEPKNVQIQKFIEDMMCRPDPNGNEQNYFESLYPLHTFRSLLSQTMYPDFQIDAHGIAYNWEYVNPDDKVNGVATFDPVGLGYLMRGIDSVYVEKCGCTLVADGPKVLNKEKRYDAAWYLLTGAYLDAAKQTGKTDDATIGYWTDDVFDQAQKTILDTLKDTDNLNFAGLVDGMTQIIHERRLMFSFLDDNQKAIEGDGLITNVSGKMPNDTASTVNVATYFNDVEPSKIDAYLKFDVNVARSLCILNGSTYYDITVTQKPLPNSKKVANSVPYIHKEDTIRTDFYAYGPQDADFLGLKILSKGIQSDLFKKGQDYNFGRYFARSRAYLSFETDNVHQFRYKKPGLDLRSINVLATPDMNGVQTSTSTGIGCDDEGDKDFSTTAVGQQRQQQQQTGAGQAGQQPSTEK